jgi:hypothetical protein
MEFKMPLRQEARFDLFHIDSVLHHIVGRTRDKSNEFMACPLHLIIMVTL